MPQLHYLIGDATEPVKKPALLIHCCNDVDKWGRGYVLALRAKYPESERKYHEWFAQGKPQLSEVQIVQVTPDICIGNMIAQRDNIWQGKVPPIRYEAMEQCLKIAYRAASERFLSVHMPRIGCVLAGGSWNIIEGLIRSSMTVESYVYTLEKQKDRWPTLYENEPL